MKIYCPNLSKCYWRPEEKENIEKYFNITNDINSADILYWRINTEFVTQNELQNFLSIEKKFKGKVINSMNSFKYTNDKIECFKKWKEHGIPIPDFFEFIDEKDFYNKLENNNITYPFLIRTINDTGGDNTFEIHSNNDLNKNLKNLIKLNKHIYLCSKIINTTYKGFFTAYRIHLCCDKIISYYGRVSNSILCYTTGFNNNMKNAWIENNIRLTNTIKKHKNIIIKSCQVLNLQHVGIDIIENENGDIFFLEVQPFYFCGNKKRTLPPFWNPYKPKELVDWLINNKNYLEEKIPNYYTYWLNKDNHFNECYKQLYNYYK
ncbi:MAG: hypothetical protein CL678_01830 [Bdellovibrionaceae bacterium]|nr:hypothetical protein [Pseudobdellovibrionaceae bacterium]|tara:strand:- start:1777 stop:2736 length:960 start_codon:yes stop_codon:yes gene_type:complete